MPDVGASRKRQIQVTPGSFSGVPAPGAGPCVDRWALRDFFGDFASSKLAELTPARYGIGQRRARTISRRRGALKPQTAPCRASTFLGRNLPVQSTFFKNGNKNNALIKLDVSAGRLWQRPLRYAFEGVPSSSLAAHPGRRGSDTPCRSHVVEAGVDRAGRAARYSTLAPRCRSASI